MNPLPPPPPVSPRKATQRRARIGTDAPISTRFYSYGNELIIRGVIDSVSNRPRSDPAAYVNKVITAIIQNDLSDLFCRCPVTASPFSQRDKAPSVYISFTTQFLSSQPSQEPRFDLMGEWKHALTRCGEPWDVSWSPQQRGKDKRCWIRFPDLAKGRLEPNAKKDATELANKIAAWYPKNHKGTVTSHFGTEGGPIIVLASPAQADALAGRELLLSGIWPTATRAAGGKQIEIESAFELIITGINAYSSGLAENLTEWISDTFIDDKSESLFHDYHIPTGHADAYVFSMLDWPSTQRVLESADRFREHFTNSMLSDLSGPTLLFEYNSAPPFRKRNIVSEIESGASQLLQQMKSTEANFNKRLDALETSTRDSFATTNSQLQTVTQNMFQMGQGIQMLTDQVRTNSVGLEQMRLENYYRTLITNIDDDVRYYRDKIRYTNNQLEAAQAEDELQKLEGRKKELLDERKAAANSFPGLPMIAPAPVPVPTLTHAPATTPAQLIAASQPPSHPSPTMSEGSPPTNIILPPLETRAGTSTTQSRTEILSSTSLPKGNRQQAASKKRKVSSDGLTTKPDVEMELSREESLVSTKLKRNKKLTKCGGTPHLFPVMSAIGTGNPFDTMRRLGTGRSTSLKTSSSQRRMHHTVLTDLTTPPTMTLTNRTNLTPISNHISVSFSSTGTRSRCRYISSPSILSGLPKLSLFLWLIPLLMLVTTVAAAPPLHMSNAFSIYALNANGLVHNIKISHLNAVITAHRPHAFVISETKTNTPLNSKLPYQDYNIFEEPGVRTDGHHIFKWGVVVGIRKDIQIHKRVTDLSSSLTGRAVVLDIILPTSNGTGFTHRLIGGYAPWNPGGQQNFWKDLKTLCNNTTHSWTIAGDLNATVEIAERGIDCAMSRLNYKRFLQDTDGIDLWSRRTDRTRRQDWTSKARGDSNAGGNIIDRVIASKKGFGDSDIRVSGTSTDYIPMTDHRAIISRTIILPPTREQTTLQDRILIPHHHLRRIQIPTRKSKHLYHDFQTRIDECIRRSKLAENPIIDDPSFLDRYSKLTEIINSTAEQVFGRTKRYIKDHSLVTTPNIQKLIHKARCAGSAIRLANNSHGYAPSPLAAKLYADALVKHPNNKTMLIQHLKQVKRQAWKDLYAERDRETTARTQRREKARITSALTGGSARSFINGSDYTGLPLAVLDPADSERMLTKPDQVMDATQRYFQTLYTHDENPKIPKPWMTTKSVLEAQNRVSKDPFKWPVKATLNDFRALVRRGNPKPSPGPDGWEKWCVKNLSDEALTLVLDLHNYIVTTSTFPGNTKSMWLTTIHKRGARTDLLNYRGILLSNFIANSPMTWLNYKLISYASKVQLIPDTQIATQPGVQSRDIMSLLASVKCWAARNKQTVYAIKRDQTKGFDRLSPQGFYDAITAYGLPTSIIDLDRAAQHQTRCTIRTAYGPSTPITINGVTKQGGPLSPLKSVLTTSLGHRYLNDTALADPDALIISTLPKIEDDPHHDTDRTKFRINMVEATDDSFIFAKSINTLIKFCYLMEWFQLAYGWTTQWSKTHAYVLEPPTGCPPKISFLTVTPSNKDNPLQESTVTIPLIQNKMEFLRTMVNEPETRFMELKSYIDAFQFPKLSMRTPITLLRKITVQHIMARCRALISLQPLKPQDALALDNLIKLKVHDTTGFPYHPSTEILTLPLEQHGADFPSIFRSNAGIAVDGLLRDLNHHIKAYRTIATITHADWMCRINDCHDPLNGQGLSRTFTHYPRKIPSAWITAQIHLSQIKPQISIRPTDTSPIWTGEVSISHVLASGQDKTPTVKPNNHGTALLALRRKGIKLLRHIGQWTRQPNACWTFVKRPTLLTTNWPQTTQNALKKILQGLNLISPTSLFSGDPELLIPRNVRRLQAELLINHLASTQALPPSGNRDSNKWASDGSMILRTTSPRQVTAAVTGPRTLVLRLPEQSHSILHGEVMALTAAFILAKNHKGNHTVYTDHLNTVRLIDDSKSGICQESRIRKRNGHSYHRWLLELLKEGRCEAKYTKGHTGGGSLESNLNEEADHYATQAQRHYSDIPHAPSSSFMMDAYTLHQEGMGWIESNIRTHIESSLIHASQQKLAIGHGHRMATWLYDKTTPPEYPYQRAYSAYSALVQLYARSGQLATANTIAMRDPQSNQTDQCRLGCDAIENPHHLFVECPAQGAVRTEAMDRIGARTTETISQNDGHLTPSQKQSILHATHHLFTDSAEVWPLGRSQYYLGHVPPLERITDTPYDERSLGLSRTLAQISREWHMASIYLASRIYGALQTKVAKARFTPRRTQTPSEPN